jgi:ABC-2 type transport system permease protein
MKQFWVFVRKEWLHILRDKKTLFILFGMPVAQILIFGFALSNEVKNSRDFTTKQLIARIDASQYFDITEFIESERQLESVFKKGKVKLIVVFPPLFESHLFQQHEAVIQFIADATDPNVGTTLVNYASAIINDYQNELLQHQKLPYRILVNARMMYNPQMEAAYNFVPGVMSMVLLLICSLMTSVAIVREKELGMMEVLLVSPVKPVWVVLSKTIPYLVLSFVNICSILLLSFYVLEVPVEGSLLLLLAVSTLFIITALSLGMFVSSVATTQTAAMFGTLVGLFMPTLMFSGFMFPIDNMPIPLQIISNVIPSKWFFYIVQSVMIKGLGFFSIWKEVLVLSGMTVVMFIISIRKFDKRLSL